jgi:hypothetical protein
MSKTGPNVLVNERLRPLIAEIEFDERKYATMLDIIGIPEWMIENAEIKMEFSEEPYHERDLLNKFTGSQLVRMGSYDTTTNALSLYPLSMQHKIFKHGKKDIPSAYLEQSSDVLSAEHNRTLAHETGHMLYHAEHWLAHTLHYQKDIAVKGDYRRIITRSALIGAVGGSELSAVTPTSPILGSAVGLLVLGGAGIAGGLIKHHGHISEAIKLYEANEQHAEEFAHDLGVVTMLGSIIQIELK